MLQDDCALIVDVQSDTSPIQDFNHLVLLLHDNDSCELVYVWQLAGFQSRLTANHDPMSQEKWTMSGDNPRPYNQDWVETSAADALQVQLLNRELGIEDIVYFTVQPVSYGPLALQPARANLAQVNPARATQVWDLGSPKAQDCSRCRLRRANQNGGRANRERIVDEPSEDADNAYSICGLSMELWPETV
ncbi:hypothetical protein MYU51_009461 [Penicillium brevicompactum]